MENSNVEKSDGLEIISIGALYQGSWDKKYWSSSRGKDRYPYPVGYHAVRTHNGVTYTMEIREGLKGPLFVITSNDGESCSGQTPDIAWDHFQKKGGPRVKLGLGKRFSCRIDGVQLFGFGNPLVQRLLRDLVTNANGAIEQKSLSSSFIYEESRLEPEAQPPDLTPYLEMPVNTRKRSRRHNITTLNSDTIVKRYQTNVCPDDAHAAISTKRGSGMPHCEDENGQICEDTEASPVVVDISTLVHRHNDPFVADSSLLQSLKSTESLGGEATFEVGHKYVTPEDSGQVKFGESSLIGRENDNGKVMNTIESNATEDSVVFAPDTLDAHKDDITDSVPESYNNIAFRVKDESAIADAADSEENLMNIHPEDASDSSISNGSLTSDSKYVDQDLANSMMTLLLPQALPLLKKKFSKKQATVSSSRLSHDNADPCLNSSAVRSSETNDEFCNIIEAISPGKPEVGVPIELLIVDREKKMHTFGTITGSEDANLVIPDTLQDGQYDNHVVDQGLQCFEFGEDKQGPCDQKVYKPDTSSIVDCNHGVQEYLDFHVRTHDSTEILNGEGYAPQSSKQEKKSAVSNFPVGYNSHCREESTDATASSVGNSLCMGTDSRMENITKMGLGTLPDCLKDTPSVEPILLGKDHACTFPGERMPICEVTSINPENDLDDSLTKLQNKQASDKHSSSTKTMSSESCKPKIVQYQRRRRFAGPMRGRTGVHGSHQSDIKTLENHSFIGGDKLFEPRGTQGEHEMSIGNSAFISCKGNALETDTASFAQMSGLDLSSRKYDSPISESITCRHDREDCNPGTSTSPHSVVAKEVGQDSGSITMMNMLLGNDIKPKEIPPRVSGNAIHSVAVVNHEDNYEDVPSFVDTSISNLEKRKFDSVTDAPHNVMDCTNSLSWLQEKNKSSFISVGQHNMKSVGSQDCRNPNYQQEFVSQDQPFMVNSEPNKCSDSFVELLGCYSHPTPLLSILLSMQGDDIHICVLCGLSQDRNMSLFIYKVPFKHSTRGCPSFLGYTSAVLSISNTTSSRKNAFAISQCQFTPDGQCIVLPNSIKVPACRERSTLCSCSLCTSYSLEDNAVNVLKVRLGYVSLVAKLKTTGSVHCVLVCEPSHLVAAEENGLHVWAMNSNWSECVDEFVLPSLDYMSPSIVELKKIPNCDALVVGHDSFGDFGLWDISKRILLSRFAAPGNSIFRVLPVGLFSWPTKTPYVSAGEEEHINTVMAATELCFSALTKHRAFLSPDDEEVAVWLLISAAHESEIQYNHQENGRGTPDGCWRLALLVKHMVIFGSVLDPRASTVAASAGHGVIGTSDGLVYMWELSTGRKLVDLHDFGGGSVSCTASDSTAGVVAVGNEEGQLLVYATSPEALANLKSKQS